MTYLYLPRLTYTVIRLKMLTYYYLRSSPELPINERVKRLYSQNSIPIVNPFRLKQMNLQIKICQGCRGPLQSSLGTVTDAPFDFCVATGQEGAADLQSPSNGTVMLARSRIGCTSSFSGCAGALKQLSCHLCRIRWLSPTDYLSQNATKLL